MRTDTSNFLPDFGAFVYAAIGDQPIQLKAWGAGSLVPDRENRLTSLSLSMRDFVLSRIDGVPMPPTITQPHMITIEFITTDVRKAAQVASRLNTDGLRLLARKDKAYKAASGEEVIPFYLDPSESLPVYEEDRLAIAAAQAKRLRKAQARGFARK